MTAHKLDLFPSSRKGRETPTLLGSLERDNLNHWLALSKEPKNVGVSLLLPEDPGPVSQTLWFLAV
jgi:hypothetical protein